MRGDEFTPFWMGFHTLLGRGGERGVNPLGREGGSSLFLKFSTPFGEGGRFSTSPLGAFLNHSFGFSTTPFGFSTTPLLFSPLCCSVVLLLFLFLLFLGSPFKCFHHFSMFPLSTTLPPFRILHSTIQSSAERNHGWEKEVIVHLGPLPLQWWVLHMLTPAVWRKNG